MIKEPQKRAIKRGLQALHKVVAAVEDFVECIGPADGSEDATPPASSGSDEVAKKAAERFLGRGGIRRSDR